MEITNFHNKKEAFPFAIEATINKVHHNSTVGKTIIEIETISGELIKIALAKGEVRRVIDSQETSKFEYRKVLRQ